MRRDPYSRLIAWLKVLLPLLALTILSTLFLLSRNIESTATIPFAEGEITERIQQQQVTGPVYAGTTADGDRITFTAESVSQALWQSSTARNLLAQLHYVGGSEITLMAKEGVMNLPENRADLSGDVVIESSAGYVMRSAQMRAGLDGATFDVPQPLTGQGPAADLQAGAMHMYKDPLTGAVQMVFTQGVKVIYDPAQ